jgi:hypothetical protein
VPWLFLRRNKYNNQEVMALDKFKKVVMLYAVLPNMQLVAESLGNTGGNKIYQITVDNKKELSGMYLEIKDEEVFARHGIFEGKPDCILHFSSINKLAKYCLENKGMPMIKGFFNPLQVFSFNSLLKKTISLYHNKKATQDEKQLIAKMYFFTIFSALNELRKEGNEVVTKWLKDASKKNYSMEIEGVENSKIWLSVQKGSSKVLKTQSTILVSQCALKFKDADEAIQFFNADNNFRHSFIETNTEVREDYVDRDYELKMLKEVFDEAFKYVK